MSWLNDKFAKRIKAAVVGKSTANNEALRKERAALNKTKKQLVKRHIKPINDRLAEIQQGLSKACEHPASHLEVTIKGWYEDDGEENSWSGDEITAECKSCGKKQKIRTNEGYNTSMFNDQDGKSLFGVDIPSIWQKLCDEEAKENAKRRKTIEEENERKEYQRLKEKFG